MLLFQIILAVWFFGCICSYRIGRYVLVDGEGIKSPEFGMFCFYIVGIILVSFAPAVGSWWLLVVLSVWIIIQFFCHWYYTIFGALEKKLEGYNSYFKNTVHVIPLSDKRIVPDLYHIILHLLLVINFVLVILEVMK